MTDSHPLNTQAPKRGLLSRSYFGRHWRGELSLPVSYFVNGLLAHLAAVALVAGISSALAGYAAPWPIFLSLVGIWGGVFVVSLWQLVGVWRSADNHTKRGGRAFWAGAAKVMVFLGLLQIATVFAQNGIPQLREGFHIVAGDASVGDIEVRLLNRGTEIEISGGIPFGASDTLSRFLSAAPEIHTIHLNSHGGRIAEAEKIRDLIRNYGLNTYVSDQCLSACTVAFLGGRERFLNRRARLGFHAGSFPGVPDEEMREVNRQLAANAVGYGVERSFADKAYRVSPADMWFPDAGELLDAGFATAMAGGQFALSGFGSNPSPERMTSALKEISLYAVLSEVEPAVFERMVGQFHDGVVKGRPEGEVFTLMRAEFSSLVDKYAPRASDDALVALGAIVVDQLFAVGSKDTLACYDFLYPSEGTTLDLSEYLEPDLVARDLEATERVIVTGAVGQHAPPASQERIDDLFEKVFAGMLQNYGAETIEKADEFFSDLPENAKEIACEVTYALFSEVVALPRSEAAQLLRAFFSQ